MELFIPEDLAVLHVWPIDDLTLRQLQTLTRGFSQLHERFDSVKQPGRSIRRNRDPGLVHLQLISLLSQSLLVFILGFSHRNRTELDCEVDRGTAPAVSPFE